MLRVCAWICTPSSVSKRDSRHAAVSHRDVGDWEHASVTLRGGADDPLFAFVAAIAQDVARLERDLALQEEMVRAGECG